MNDNDQKLGRGLGRGLDSLIPGGSDDANSSGSVKEVPINLIDVNPHQPRTVFDETELQELSDSIKKHGVLQPLVVSPKDDHFELIAGERRLRASKKAGLSRVPVIIRDADDHQKLELAIIENVHRENLNPIDEALSYRKLIEEFGYTQEQVSAAVGKSRASVANKIRILGLSTDIKKAIKEGRIAEGHAKALLSISDPQKQRALFDSIVAGGLNVREAEKKASSVSPQKTFTGPNSEEMAIFKQLSDDLKDYLGTKISIKKSSKGGRIEIEYFSNEELARIYQKIKGIE